MSKKKGAPKFLQALQTKWQGQGLSSTESIVAAAGTSQRDEVGNTCKLASRGDSRVIGFNQLVFFSTQTRDAWMLDWEDELAVCLMKDGLPQAVELGGSTPDGCANPQKLHPLDHSVNQGFYSEQTTGIRESASRKKRRRLPRWNRLYTFNIGWFEFLAFETFSAPKEKDKLFIRPMAGEDGVLGAELRSRFNRSRLARNLVPQAPLRHLENALPTLKDAETGQRGNHTPARRSRTMGR
jgi:hypothetical protein